MFGQEGSLLKACVYKAWFSMWGFWEEYENMSSLISSTDKGNDRFII